MMIWRSLQAGQIVAALAVIIAGRQRRDAARRDVTRLGDRETEVGQGAQQLPNGQIGSKPR